MKLPEIFRFEFAYQVRRVSTWLYFAVLVFFAFVLTREDFIADARNGDYFLNAPFIVAVVTASGCVMWLLVAAFVAGDAAARDVEAGMHPLTYTAPVSKADYLGGRFIAAFVVNALILLALPAGILLAVGSAGVEPEILGPFRPTAYVTAYAFIALPNAFVATAIQFSFAALGRRAIASYIGGLLLGVTAFVATFLEQEAAQMLDPIGAIAFDDLRNRLTPIELNTGLIALEGSWLTNRLLWLGIALGTLAFTHFRFRFCHPAARIWWSRITRHRDAHAPAPAAAAIARSTICMPLLQRTFGFPTHVRQALAIAWASLGSIVKSWSGILLLALAAMLAVLSLDLEHMGVWLLPRADYVLRGLTVDPDAPPAYLIIPLLIVFWSGELVWRERGAGLSEIVDAAPLPTSVLLLGKFLGLGLVLGLCMALRMAGGIVVQILMGHHDFEIDLYFKILFGLQLAVYLLLALLALSVHVVVNHRHVGHLVTVLVFLLVALAPQFAIAHDLLVPGSGPEWSYTEMRGFGPSLGPWLWFKLYWAAWALLLAVAARLLWVRGREGGLGVRLHIARRRFTRSTAATAAAAVAGILTLGGFIFYNTNVLNAYRTASDQIERFAEYERRYGQYEGIPQPRLTRTDLHVEIYPQRRAAEIRGAYRLVNSSPVAIDAIHLGTARDVETGAVAFDRPAAGVLVDDDRGYRIYALETPLQPGDSLQLDFEVDVEPRGFQTSGVDASVVANGSWFMNRYWFPVIGYQPDREIPNATIRKAQGLPPRPAIPSLDDVQAKRLQAGAELIAFEAIVGTDEDQIAVAPGGLRRTWTEGGRRYFHYSTDAPIRNVYSFFSADYVVHERQWNDVAIQIFHHPGNTANLDRMARSLRASLDYCTEQFGPYPYSHIRLVEHPGFAVGLRAGAFNITYEEGFSLLNPGDGARDFDLVFAVVAHEVAHQWWGEQLAPASVEGAVLLTESLAWYSAYRVVEEAYGTEHLRRLLSRMRGPSPIRPERATVPLLRATGQYLGYRKGPFAMYALSEYIGEERVNEALRRFLEEHASGAPPLPTSLDLYRELQAVTPDSLQDLLHDLFEMNTFWELETERATAEQVEAGTWKVTLEVRARKVVVDTEGLETEMPMDDWVEIGVFAPAEAGNGPGEPLYLQMHRLRSGQQTVTVTVPRKPAHAGTDPYHLLIDLEMDDNIEEVKVRAEGA